MVRLALVSGTLKEEEGTLFLEGKDASGPFRVALVAKGLSPGERVILHGETVLVDGQVRFRPRSGTRLEGVEGPDVNDARLVGEAVEYVAPKGRGPGILRVRVGEDVFPVHVWGEARDALAEMPEEAIPGAAVYVTGRLTRDTWGKPPRHEDRITAVGIAVLPGAEARIELEEVAS